MIIYGTTGLTSTVSSGAFHCPRCGQQSYQQKKVRRYFTLYFIPLIPLDTLGEYVECGLCRGTYRSEVLHHRPQTEGQQLEAEFETAVRGVMLRMMLADGSIEKEEIETVRGIYQKLTGKDLSPMAIHAEAGELQNSRGDMFAALRDVAGRLNDSGKEMVFRAAFMVAVADGVFEESEKKLLTQITAALGMAPAHVKQVLTELSQ